MKTKALLLITLRGLSMMLFAVAVAWIVIDGLLPQVGFDIGDKARRIALLIAVWLGFAWASGWILKKIKKAANARPI